PPLPSPCRIVPRLQPRSLSLLTFHIRIQNSEYRILNSYFRIWQARRESNPQPPVLETGALPIELLAYAARDSGLGIWDSQDPFVPVESRIPSRIPNPESRIPSYFDSLCPV